MHAIFQKILLILTGVCLILTASAGWLFAQNFPASTFNFEPRVGLFGSCNPRVQSIWTYGLAAGVFISENVALEVEGLGVYMDETRPLRLSSGTDELSRKSNGFASNINIRWHMLTASKASLYMGAGIGGLWADYATPYDGFEDSVTENCELGGTLALTEVINLRGSFRYWHIGQFSEQGISAFGGTVGLNFSF